MNSIISLKKSIHFPDFLQIIFFSLFYCLNNFFFFERSFVCIHPTQSTNPRHAKFASQMARSTYQVFDENLIQISQDAGNPYDNAVAEATFKVIKTEFVWNETFHTLEELKIKLWDYVNWYNHHRIHSSLGYQTPVQYRENNLKKFV